MTSTRPEFRRQESWRYKRVAPNWRRPRGVTSKMRKEESGFPAKVKVGYGSDSSTRGRHPRGLVERIVWRESELDELDPKIHILRIAGRVGERKRLGILAKAKEQSFHIANPGKEESRPITEATVEEEKAPVSKVETLSEEPGEEVEASATEEGSTTVEEDSE
jgi:large subunit ribosomal protein L32e